jgi:hypothetical protein
MEKLLLTTGFKEINQVISLAWDVSTARWPEVKKDLALRKMEISDLKQCYLIDRVAFKPIWRNTFTQLQAAYQEAFYASVIEIDGAVRSYQISTTNPQGGHLARLAVIPDYQNLVWEAECYQMFWTGFLHMVFWMSVLTPRLIIHFRWIFTVNLASLIYLKFTWYSSISQVGDPCSLGEKS